MTTAETFRQHRNTAPRDVVGVSYEILCDETRTAIATELRAEGFYIPSTDDKWLKVLWGTP